MPQTPPSMIAAADRVVNAEIVVAAPIVDTGQAPIEAEFADSAMVPTVVCAEALEEPAIVDERGPIRRLWETLSWTAQWLFGVFSLVLALSLLSTYPLLQMLSL